jgi:hypothetical protein
MGQHQTTVAELRARLNSAPQVEAEYQQLNRDYDVNKAQYTALLESYQKARLGERADNAGSVRFEVVLPPSAPIVPAAPKRGALLAGVWLAAVGLGAVLAYAMNLFRPIVSSLRVVHELTPFPVLGVVGVAFPSRARQELRRDLWRFSAAGACLIAAFAIVLVLNGAGARLNAQPVIAVATS